MTEAFDPQSDDGQIDGTVPDVVAIQEFRDARDLLLAHGGDYEAAYRGFRWPRLETFNWKVDWFDGVLAAEQPGQRALPAVWHCSATRCAREAVGRDVGLQRRERSREDDRSSSH